MASWLNWRSADRRRPRFWLSSHCWLRLRRRRTSAVGKVVALRFEAQVADGVVPQQTVVEAQCGRHARRELVIMFQAPGTQGKAQQLVGQLPAGTDSATDIADQYLIIVTVAAARHSFEAATDLP